MIAERAPGTQIAQPGKATRAPADDELTDEDQAEQQPAERPKSVFDAPLQRDLEPPPAVEPTDDDSEA